MVNHQPNKPFNSLPIPPSSPSPPTPQQFQPLIVFMQISLKFTSKFPKFLLNSRLAFYLLAGTLEVTILHWLQFNKSKFNVSKTELSFPSMALPVSHKFSSLEVLEPSPTSPRLTSHNQSVTNSYIFHLYWSFWDPCFPFYKLCSRFRHLLTSWLAMISLWLPSLESLPGLIHDTHSC